MDRVDGVQNRLAGRVRQEVGTRRVVDRRERGLAILGDLEGTVRRVRTEHADDVRHRRDSGQHRVDLRPDAGCVKAPMRVVPDDRVDVPSLRLVFLVQQVDDSLGLGSGQAEVRRVLTSNPGGQYGHRDRDQNPADNDQPPMRHAPARQSDHVCAPPRGESVRGCGYLCPEGSLHEPRELLSARLGFLSRLDMGPLRSRISLGLGPRGQ